MRVPCASARHAVGTKLWDHLRGWRWRGVATAEETSTSTSRLPLSKGLESRLRQLSWCPLTETTLKLLRPVLEGRDVLAVMPRGRSRLLGYLLPLLDKMKTERWSLDETVLVLLPKRKDAEKAYTTSNVLRKWSLRTILLAGDGGDVSKRSQLALLRRGAQLVLCTAQRFKELLQEGLLFQNVAAKPPADGVAAQRVRLRCIVLEDVEELLAEVGDELRGLLASLGRLQHVILAKDSRGAELTQDPVFIDTGPGLAAVHAEHLCCELPTNAMRRARLLAFLLDERLKGSVPQPRNAAKALVVCLRRGDLAQLSNHAMLRQKLLALEEQMPSEEQEEILGLFKSLPGQIMLTTDHTLAVRELPAVQLVVHMMVPPSDVYLQRLSCLSSRQREGNPPSSLLLYAGHQQPRLRDLERESGLRFSAVPKPSDDELRKAVLQALAKELTLATQQYDSLAFQGDAEQQLDVHGPRLLAAALVLLERRRKGEEWLSPLSGRPRYTPLLLADPHLEKLRSRQNVVSAVQRVLKGRFNSERVVTQAQIGRIELSEKGWLVDVPRALVPLLLEDRGLKARGIPVLPVSDVPDILEDQSHLRQKVRLTRRRRRALQGNLAQRRHQERQEFLYPSGRRSLFGRFFQAGTKGKSPAATLSTLSGFVKVDGIRGSKDPL